MIDSKDIRDKKSNSLIDEFDRLDSASSAEVETLLQDEENADFAKAILSYRQARMKQRLAQPDLKREWLDFCAEQIGRAHV